MELIAQFDRFLAKLLRAFVIAALVVTLILITLGVVARVIPVFSMSGYDEVIEWLVAWMTFVGTIALWRQGLLFNIDLSSYLKSPMATRALRVFSRILMLLFAVVFTWKGWEFASETVETMPFLFISKKSWYLSMPICGALMTAYAVVDLLRSVLGWPNPHEVAAAAESP
jgi:TRAP-type C4-dicarboxylate transport system permease small subunit